MRLVFNAEMLAKSADCGNEIELEKCDIEKSDNPKDPKFDYFKNLVMQHLTELEKRENKTVAKSFDILDDIQKSGMAVGTVRTWNGQKFKKIAPKKWVRVYESESRGAKMALAALRRKCAECKDSQELLQLVLANRERFVDANGKPLAFMQEFSAYVSSLNEKHEGEKKKKATLGADEILEEKRRKETKTPKYKVGDIISEDGTRGGEVKILKVNGDKLTVEPNDNFLGLKPYELSIAELEEKDREERERLIESTKKMGDKRLVDMLSADKPQSDNGEKTAKKENGTSTIPSSAKNYTAETSPKPSDSTIPQNGGKSSGIESIRSKYQSSKSIEGDEDEIYIGKETISGKWKLVEADAPSASHDEITFHKTKGFPTATDGGTVNDRDYEHDTAAQEAVLDMSADFDGRALGFDSPIVVTQDGVVTSGNNRTMSSKLAARKGTDTKYIEALKKRAKKFGFTADDVAQFKHPRVVFETEHKGNYTTDEFAKYNESGKKAKSPIEKAVEVSKRMKAETIESIAGNIGEFDTMGELYADKKASLEIFNTLISSNIIQKTDLSQYYTDGGITETGKEFLETVLVGSVINETNIRALNGAKAVRQKLVRAIVPLVENKGMKGYSINKELNEAVSIAIEVSGEKSKKQPAFRSVEEYSQLRDLFEKQDPVAIELAKKLDGRTQKEFAEFMLEMNGGLRPAANGEVDIFLGGVESKEEIVSRVLKIKDTVKKALDKFFGLFGATA